MPNINNKIHFNVNELTSLLISHYILNYKNVFDILCLKQKPVKINEFS